MKLPEFIKERLNKLPIFSSILWETPEHERPIFLVKVPPATNFAFYAIGLGPVTVHSIDPQHTVVSIVLLLRDTRLGKKAPLISVACCINPYAEQDQEVGYVLAKDQYITIAAVAADSLTLKGAKQRSWPKKRRQTLSRLLTHSRTNQNKSQVSTPLTYLNSKTNYPDMLNSSHGQLTSFSSKTQVKHDLHHLVSLEASLAPLLQSVPPMMLERAKQFHKQGYTHAYICNLTSAELEAIAAMLDNPSLSPVSLPEVPMWIGLPSPIRSFIQEASALFLYSSEHKQLLSSDKKNDEQETEWLSNTAGYQQADWQLHVIDKRGIAVLQLLYLPDLKKWELATTHQCPTNTCFDLTPLMQVHSLSKTLLPCNSCQSEASFWQGCLSAILAVVYESMTRESQQLLPTEQQAEELVISSEVASDAFFVSQTAKQILASLPAFSGFLFSAKELHYAQPIFSDIPLLLIKLPETYPFLECHVIFQEMQQHDSPLRGSVVCLALLLQHPSHPDITTRCLFISSAYDDYNILRQVASHQNNKVNIMAISENQACTIMGVQYLSWADHIQKQAQTAIKKTTLLKLKEKNRIRLEWIQENLLPKKFQPIQLTSLPTKMSLPVQQNASQTSPVLHPQSMQEKYRAHLFAEEQRLKQARGKPLAEKERNLRAIQKQFEALKYAYICIVKNSALYMLHDLLTQQQHILLGKMPPLPATHMWLEFEYPIASRFGNGTIDIWVIWIRECSSLEGRQNGQTSKQWICTLLGRDAQEIGCTYLYAPGHTTVWSVTQEYRCPHQICVRRVQTGGSSTIQSLCAGCRAGLEFWATVLHLSLRMHRGDYANREDVLKSAAAKITIEPQYAESNLRNTYAMKYIDASVQHVEHRLQKAVPRGSWVVALRATHPELIETAQVWTRPHQRFIRSSRTLVPVSGHYKTVHRRKDKLRKNILIAKQYNNDQRGRKL